MADVDNEIISVVSEEGVRGNSSEICKIVTLMESRRENAYLPFSITNFVKMWKAFFFFFFFISSTQFLHLNEAW